MNIKSVEPFENAPENEGDRGRAETTLPLEASLPFHFRCLARPATKRGMSAKLSIGFLGAGRMATALAKGFIRAGLVDGSQVMASDPSEVACLNFAKETGGKTTAFNPDVVKFARVLLLAVKPDQVGGVLGEIRDGFSDNHLLLSIAAGVTLVK